MKSRPDHPWSRSRTHSGDADTALIPPPRAASWIRERLRRATMRAASSSESAPATYAAAISPCECPTTASGTTPIDRHTRARDTITANNTGWTTSTRSSDAADSVPVTTSTSDQSTHCASTFAHSSMPRAKTADSAYRRRPIPAHCEPWPGNTKTTGPPGPSATPRITRAESPPAASASRPASASSRSPLSRTARCANDDRVDAREYPTSAMGSVVSAVTRARSLAACSRSAGSERADSTHGSTRTAWAETSPEARDVVRTSA